MTTPQTESDQPVEDWDKPLSPELVKELSTLKPWRSILAVAFEWAVIASAIYASLKLWDVHIAAGIAGYIFAVILIGSRQHALATLMHEGSHYRMFSNRLLNEWFVQLFVAWPLLIDVRMYRKLHFAHHRAPNTDDDPDWELRETGDWSFPKTRTGLFFLFLGDALGLRIVDQYHFFGRYGIRRGRKQDRWDNVRLIHFILLFGALTYFGWWPVYLAYWIVPTITWLKVVLRMRTIAEHYALEYDHIYRQTRTTLPAFWERILFAPEYINYHLEHHLYPSVPFYHLPRLHRELMKNENFQQNAHLTRGYTGVLAECLSCEHLTNQKIQQMRSGA